MKHRAYAQHVQKFVGEMKRVTKAKNADYSAGTDDAMANYYEVGDAAHVSPLQAWMVLVAKHLTAIKRFIKDGRVDSESIHGRFIDLANYGMLGDALVKDLRERGLLPGDKRPTRRAKKIKRPVKKAKKIKRPVKKAKPAAV
jgi:hypothetical protein